MGGRQLWGAAYLADPFKDGLRVGVFSAVGYAIVSLAVFGDPVASTALSTGLFLVLMTVWMTVVLHVKAKRAGQRIR